MYKKITEENNKKININIKDKYYFIGVSFSSINSIDSAGAIIDKDLNIISLQKLATFHDMEFFLRNNILDITHSLIGISLPKNEIMISQKWKYASRTYHPVNLNSRIKSIDNWTQRYSTKGIDLFKKLKNENKYDIFRYEFSNLKNNLGYADAYIDRTPADCKALQTALKYKFRLKGIPSSNMLPVAQLEALTGAYFAKCIADENNNIEKYMTYGDLDVLGFSV